MYFPINSPLHKVENELLNKKQVGLWIKRDDLIHPEISGNKFRKLKYNLACAKEQGKSSILTFGGAYSNHIAATACAGDLFGFETIGIIRGEEPKDWSHTLRKAKEYGMKLKFISRAKYSNKNEKGFVEELENEFGNFYLVPEGGANSLGMKGCAEILVEVHQEFDFVCVSCGTGTTLAGIVSSLKPKQKAIGFPALKGGDFIRKEVEDLLGEDIQDKVELMSNYHFGGYAKVDQKLIDFTREFYKNTSIQLDLVYTAKMFYGFFDLLKQDYFPKNSKVLSIHTGGLQGNEGIFKKLGVKSPFC